MAATYSTIRITTSDASTGVSETLSGVTTVTRQNSGVTYDFISVSVDDTNEIISGTKSDGTITTFETGATLSISIEV